MTLLFVCGKLREASAYIHYVGMWTQCTLLHLVLMVVTLLVDRLTNIYISGPPMMDLLCDSIKGKVAYLRFAGIVMEIN